MRFSGKCDDLTLNLYENRLLQLLPPFLAESEERGNPYMYPAQGDMQWPPRVAVSQFSLAVRF